MSAHPFEETRKVRVVQVRMARGDHEPVSVRLGAAEQLHIVDVGGVDHVTALRVRGSLRVAVPGHLHRSVRLVAYIHSHHRV